MTGADPINERMDEEGTGLNPKQGRSQPGPSKKRQIQLAHIFKDKLWSDAESISLRRAEVRDH